MSGSDESDKLMHELLHSDTYTRALKHLGVLIEHACEHGEHSAEALLVAPGNDFPRHVVALALIQLVHGVVTEHPPLGRVQREMVASGALSLGEELMLPELPAGWR